LNRVFDSEEANAIRRKLISNVLEFILADNCIIALEVGWAISHVCSEAKVHRAWNVIDAHL
jgi:hypothetical protein